MKTSFETDLDEGQRIALKGAYEMFCQKRVKIGENGTYTDDAIEEIQYVYVLLIQLANVYGIRGSMKQIFCALLPQMLKGISVLEMQIYAKFMHLDLPIEILESEDFDIISESIILTNVRRLQRLNWKRYVAACFFESEEDAELFRPEVFALNDEEDFRIDTREKVLSNGVEYYFVKIGEMTMDSLDEKFTFEECLHILMCIGPLYGTKWDGGYWTAEDGKEIEMERILRWEIDNYTTKNDLIRSLIMTIESFGLDPRYYITTEGLISPILEENDDYILSICDTISWKVDEIKAAAEWEGITISEKPINILYNEFVMSQLSRTFLSHQGKHRSTLFSLHTDKISNGKSVELIPESDLIFWGKRDGVSKLTPYSLEELYYTFSKSACVPFDPQAIAKDPENSLMLWYIFPLRSIRKLNRQILSKKVANPWARSLAKECICILENDGEKMREAKSMFHNDFVRGLKSAVNGLNPEPDEDYQLLRKMVAQTLIQMFNVGDILKDFNETLNVYNTEALQVLRLHQLGEEIPETMWTGRPQVEAKQLVVSLQYYISQIPYGWNKIFGNLHVMRFYNGKIDMSFENSDFTFTYFLEILHTACSMGLTGTIETCGKWLYISSNLYHKMIMGSWIMESDEDIMFE